MIKNIIFDFGGVIYDINHNKTKEAFVDLGIKNFDLLYGHTIQTSLFEDFEIGKLSPGKFRKSIRLHLPVLISDNEIDTAWNALLVGFNLARLDLLALVKKHYRIFLLSNTNQIHFEQYMGELKRINRLEDFNNLFDKLYFSHQIGMRKPDRKIFEYVLNESRLKPEETVFIDDYKLNITTGKHCGIHSILLEPGKDLMDLFDAKGNLNGF